MKYTVEEALLSSSPPFAFFGLFLVRAQPGHIAIGPMVSQKQRTAAAAATKTCARAKASRQPVERHIYDICSMRYAVRSM
jgi:hypothetical protein